MKAINYRKDKNSNIPEEIVRSYSKMVKAEEAYYSSVKNHHPECIFSAGENVIYTKRDREYCGRIESISYDPYRYSSTFGWYITIKPLNKGWVKREGHRALLHPSDFDEIKKA